jgi:hypothetical protein
MQVDPPADASKSGSKNTKKNVGSNRSKGNTHGMFSGVSYPLRSVCKHFSSVFSGKKLKPILGVHLLRFAHGTTVAEYHRLIIEPIKVFPVVFSVSLVGRCLSHLFYTRLPLFARRYGC